MNLNTIHYYNGEDYASSAQFGQAFFTLLREKVTPEQPLIFLCIGSDRATVNRLQTGTAHQQKLSGVRHVRGPGSRKKFGDCRGTNPPSP